MQPAARPLDSIRYEILPFGSAVSEATVVRGPLTLTVTCSPKQGLDHALDVACRLRALGHVVILHLAARMVRSNEHLDSLLGRMASNGITDVFLVGGDATEPHGPYSSALEILPVLRAHAHAPRSIGVTAYPEGHPLISGQVLDDVLRQKDSQADYMTTQLCFDPHVLTRWLERTRGAGVELPAFIGLPGPIHRGRLLEISLRVGVGASVSFLRKQRGVTRLLGRRHDASTQLYTTFAPMIGRELGVAGLHFFTFNRLVESARFVQRQAADQQARPGAWRDVVSPSIRQEPQST